MFALKIDTDGATTDVTLAGVPDILKLDDVDGMHALIGAVQSELGGESGVVHIADDVAMILLMGDAPGDPNVAAATFANTLEREAMADIREMVSAIFGPDAVTELIAESDKPIYGPALFIGSLGSGPASLSERRADQARLIARGVTADAS